MKPSENRTAANLGDDAFDRYAAEYEDALNKGLRFTGEDKDFYSMGRAEWLSNRLTELEFRPRTCLDFGCGVGNSFASLESQFKLSNYFGYDPSVQSICRARQSVVSALARFEFLSDSIPASSFDLAFTNGVFHHIPPNIRSEALEHVWRALRPGGWFAFWENNRWNPMVHFVMSRVPFDHDAQMLFPYQARALLSGAGFELVSTDFAFVFPSFLKAFRPIEKVVCKLPLGGQYLILARKPMVPFNAEQ